VYACLHACTLDDASGPAPAAAFAGKSKTNLEVSSLATDTTTPDHALLGAYVGSAAPENEHRLDAMAQWLGREPDYAVTFLNQNSWKDFDSSVSWVLGQWPNHEKLLISVPLIPNGADLGTAASGAYNEHYLEAAQKIAAYDPNAVIPRRRGDERRLVSVGRRIEP
jgi:hypothetical protein